MSQERKKGADETDLAVAHDKFYLTEYINSCVIYFVVDLCFDRGGRRAEKSSRTIVVFSLPENLDALVECGVSRLAPPRGIVMRTF